MIDKPLATDDVDDDFTRPAFPMEHPARPFYLARPCPSWCAYPHDWKKWAYDDRSHRSADYDITLSPMDAIVDAGRGRGRRGALD